MFSKKSRRTTTLLPMSFSTPNTKSKNKRDTAPAITYNRSNNISLPVQSFMHIPQSYRNNEKGMKWGPPTWLFLHTLAEKVKDTHFSKLRNDLLKNVFTICTNLPCPECSMHAKIYLNNINFNAIQTKSQFKLMLWEFHNSVNRRKGYNVFNEVDLEKTYKEQVLTSTFYNFLVKFKDRGANNRFISEDMYRKEITKNLVNWFNINKEHFDE